ncbi:nicotinate-nucleotide--dimethylbenzimidazole phosphoribosyltransferase [Streptomyces sp. NPDC086787]|uniref:nicotinate-nucleotide--dimethylbenzimidazole phosphoribosyltransferase n=1 Tax=Streptomyces sp. NPDC086787 TaxID=3365759 RepID=UPI0038012A1A
MTDTGRVPGEGQPESAGTADQPGVPAHGGYGYLSETTAEDEDLLLPGAQSAWGNEVPPPAPEPVVEAVHEPGPHETDGRDSGSVDLGGVRLPDLPVSVPPSPILSAPHEQGASVPQRRPLHLGPQIPDASASPVRSLADRGPAGAPVPVRQPGSPASGPEYLDAQPLRDLAPQSAAPWGAAPVAQADLGAPAPAMETAVPLVETAVPFAEPAPEQTGQTTDAAQAAVARLAMEAAAAGGIAETAPSPSADLAGSESPHSTESSPVAQVPDAVPGPPAAEVTTAPEDAQESVASVESVEAREPEAAPLPEDPEDPAESEAVPETTAEVPEPHAATPVDGVPIAPQPVEPDAAVQVTEPETEQPSAEAPFAEQTHWPEPAQEPQEQEPREPEAVTAEAQPADPGHTAAIQAPTVVPPREPEAAAPAEQPAEPGPSAQMPAEQEILEVAAEGDDQAARQGTVPPQVHPDHSLGRFVQVEGTVPTTPHLAPTPPRPLILPTQDAPAATPEAVATVPAPREAEPAAVPTAPTGERSPEDAVQQSAEQNVVQQNSAEPDAPEPEAVQPDAAQPEATEPEPVESDLLTPEAVQRAEDLETRAAEPEEGTENTESAESAVAAEAPRPVGPAAPGYDDAEREAVLRVMRERRDIRNGFRDDPIPHDVLLRVLEAAHTAPSVGHSQPWDFVVIRSAETRRTMHELAMSQREAYAKSLPKGRAKQFKELKIEAILDTPVNIVVTADPTRGGRHTLGRHTQPQMAPYSAALAVENLWLAARAEGLGVGWVSFFDEREMVRALGLPEHLEVIAYLCVGYVDEFPDEPELMQAGWSKRRPLSWVVHEETYGRRALPGEDPHDLLAETVAGIRPLDAKALGEAWERQKRMTKPAGALGMLEIISAQLSGLSRQCPPPIPEPAAVAIFAGDHGVHAQGVTPWPQEVTAQMVANFLGGGAVCNAFANQVGAEVCVVDVGVVADLPATPGLLPRKIRGGTSDMTAGPAMTREEAKAAIEVGIETARDLVAAGNRALLTGEMGIANTTASAALISVFTGADPAEVTGRGTGINDETLARKTEVVRRAIELHQPDPADPIGVLAAIGGFEHAALVGLLLGGASLRTPVILDGVSAGAAALVARAIAPEVLAACIAGHRSAEPGHVAALNKLGLRPLVDLDLRLGEGTGALLALPLVQSTARAMHEVATFDSAGVTEK